jgi:TFIIF-interacting CTD phosphatase-like protein
MKHRRNIILDLDQTLISSEYLDQFDKKTHLAALKTLKHVIMPQQFIIFQRPHLQQFLDFLFSNFNVSVWTAASRDYGLYIIENFILTKPERRIDFFFYSYHCNFATKTFNKLKPLSMLWDVFNLTHYNASNTFIIDDNYDVFKIQTKNTFMIKEFKYNNSGSDNDKELLKMIHQLRALI